jgi:hypothetical protein
VKTPPAKSILVRKMVAYTTICCVLCLLNVFALSPDERVAAENLLLQLRDGGSVAMFKERIQSLSNSDRNLLIVLLRDTVDYTSRKHPAEARVLNTIPLVELAMLGDDPALTERVKEFLTHGTRSVPTELLLLSNPKVIPLIGEGLFKDEKPQIVGDVYRRPTQETIKNVMLHTLSDSAEFNSDVAGWARRVSGGDAIAVVRKWYRANETKLKAGNFKAVEAGPELSSSNGNPPVPSGGGATPSSVPPLSPPVRSNGKPPADVLLPTSGGNGFLSTVVLILVVVGGLFWKFGRRR